MVECIGKGGRMLSEQVAGCCGIRSPIGKTPSAEAEHNHYAQRDVLDLVA